MSSAASTLIDGDARKRIEKNRLQRAIQQYARAPTEDELRRLRQMIGAVDPHARDLFVGMHAVTLVHENLHQLDVDGLASLKADGVHAHAAFVNSHLENHPIERADSVLFVMRGAMGSVPQVFAIDRIFIHTRTAVLFDGELCLRKKRLTPDEFRAINSGQNVHTRCYLQYPTATDAQAAADGIDVTSDSYQSVYDSHFELVYAAFDCMYLQRKSQTNRPFSERMAIVHKLTESLPIADNTKRYRDRLAQITAAVQYAGGVENFSIQIFMKPMFHVQHAHSAMHLVQACMRGIGTDGVIFNNASDTYVVGVNQRLLKWKLEHTADFVIVRQTGTTDLLPTKYALYVQDGGKPVHVGGNVLLDTDNAQQLIQRYAVHSGTGQRASVIECTGVCLQTPLIDGSLAVYWRPVQARAEKKTPNSLETYRNVVAAVLNHVDEAALVTYLANRRAGKPL
jgi:hypothetical protein